MDNRDWKISEQEVVKLFLFEDKEAGEHFIKDVRKIAQREGHMIRFRRMTSGEIRVKIPVLSPGNFTESEVRLMNLINKLGG
jgi:pterin-4a-carbinolamine dehydratase